MAVEVMYTLKVFYHLQRQISYFKAVSEFLFQIDNSTRQIAYTADRNVREWT